MATEEEDGRIFGSIKSITLVTGGNVDIKKMLESPNGQKLNHVYRHCQLKQYGLSTHLCIYIRVPEVKEETQTRLTFFEVLNWEKNDGAKELKSKMSRAGLCNRNAENGGFPKPPYSINLNQGDDYQETPDIFKHYQEDMKFIKKFKFAIADFLA